MCVHDGMLEWNDGMVFALDCWWLRVLGPGGGGGLYISWLRVRVTSSSGLICA